MLKDRARLIDGKTFEDPDFDNFFPRIRRLNLGGCQLGVDTTRTSVSMFPADPRDDRTVMRKIALGEIEEILVRHYPGQTAADKKAEAELLRTQFKARWAEIESIMPLDRLRSGYDTLHFTLEGARSRYHQQSAPAPKDELPGDLAPHKGDGLDIPPMLDRRRAMAPQRHKSRPTSISYPPDSHTNGRR